MATSPDQVRSHLSLVTTAAATEIASVGAAATTPEETRQILLAAAPLIVAQYSDGSAALALDWYDELRSDAVTDRAFTPVPVVVATDPRVQAIVAASTAAALEGAATAEAPEIPVRLVAEALQELVADAFRATVTENVHQDPEAVGWRRFARPEACKFCKMLAAKGAVYTKETARFAAHGAVTPGGRRGGNCMCIAGPAFGGREDWAEATPMQYMASEKRRTPEQRARLREYLNEHFADAPG